jgi:hypothetical protein
VFTAMLLVADLKFLLNDQHSRMQQMPVV